DMLAPVFMSAVSDASTDTITFTMDSILNTVNRPDIGDFYVEINSIALLSTDNLSVAVNGTDVTLFIKDLLMTNGDSVRVIYDDTVGDVSSAIQDSAGNDAISFQYIGTAVL
ncbi:MAG: SwmB domain-containing protein, partial [Sulfuricurvum sp.]|nr:SwmB domain-containing protein [Sulfuricurvum sp.]